MYVTHERRFKSTVQTESLIQELREEQHTNTHTHTYETKIKWRGWKPFDLSRSQAAGKQERNTNTRTNRMILTTEDWIERAL